MKRIIFMVLITVSYNIAFSQTCDSTLIPAEASPYKYKKINNRCEGFYRSPVTTPRIDIIGITKGKFNYDLNDKEVITIYSPLIKDRVISVRAQPVPLKIYYRMDTTIPAADSVRWNIKDVLLPKNLKAEIIRISGYYHSDEEDIYVPIRTDALINNIRNDTYVYVTFRPTINVDSIQYSIYNYKTGVPSGWQQYLLNSCLAGQDIAIRLVLDKGLYQLSLSAHIEDSEDEWINKQITINSGIANQ